MPKRPQHHNEHVSGNPAVRARIARVAAAPPKARKDWTDEEIVLDFHLRMRRAFKGTPFTLRERLRALRRAQARVEAEGRRMPHMLAVER